MGSNWQQRDAKLAKRDKQKRMRGNRSIMELAGAHERRVKREQDEYERKRKPAR